MKFADDTTVIGLISNNDEGAYRDEVENLSIWCHSNNLSLNVEKTKELIIDFRRTKTVKFVVCINNIPVEIVSSFKFLGIQITDTLSWSLNTSCVVKRAQQRLYFLRCLKKYSMSMKTLINFYQATIESILTGCILVWFGNTTAQDCKHLTKIVKTASKIIGTPLPLLQDIYTTRCKRKALNTTKDTSHPAHSLFLYLPSGKRLQNIRARTSRLRDSFYPQAVRLLNSSS